MAWTEKARQAALAARRLKKIRTVYTGETVRGLRVSPIAKTGQQYRGGLTGLSVKKTRVLVSLLRSDQTAVELGKLKSLSAISKRKAGRPKVVALGDGKYGLIDGNHRATLSVLAKQKTIMVDQLIRKRT